MKNFDIRRFGRVVKWDLTTNRRSTVKMTAAMALAMLLAFVYTTYQNLNRMRIWPDEMPKHVEGLAIVTNLFFVAFMTVGASLIFVNMKTVQRRITFLTLPATALEKFAARWLYSTAGFFLMFAAALVIADIIHLVTCLAIWHLDIRSVTVFGTKYFVEMFYDAWIYEDPTMPFRPQLHYILLVTVIILIHALFVLGGTFFRRAQWVTTSATIVIVALVWGIIWEKIETPVNDIMDKYFWRSDLYVPVIVCIIVSVAAIIASYYAAYRLFRRSQVITNKWINV